MGIHINMVKGDFIFYAWVEKEDERLKKTEKELESLGYVLKEEDHGWLNIYRHYENAEGDEKVVTICCV